MNSVLFLIITTAALLTVLYTTPGGVIFGFKLRIIYAAVVMALFYLSLAAGVLDDVFKIVNSDNFDDYIYGFTLFCWLVIITPYSARTQATLNAIRAQTRQNSQ